MMDVSLVGLTSIVCGSTSGIGRACAKVIAEQGATVVLLARDEQRLVRARDELPAEYEQHHVFLRADFADPEQVREVVEAALPELGPVHILVNNTGGPPGGPIVDAGPQEFEKAFRSHLVCNQILSQLVLPGMKSGGYGRILNIVSTSVRQPIPLLGVSNTTRAAVAAWAKTLSREVAPFGVTVNCVLPGATRTDRLASLIRSRAEREGTAFEAEESRWLSQIPAGRFAEPTEIAWAVSFLASPAAAYITGVNLPVDGGRIESL